MKAKTKIFYIITHAPKKILYNFIQKNAKPVTLSFLNRKHIKRYLFNTSNYIKSWNKIYALQIYFVVMMRARVTYRGWGGHHYLYLFQSTLL